MSGEINDSIGSEKEVSGGFTFRFPTYEEFINGKMKVGVGSETVDSESLFPYENRCEFSYGKELESDDVKVGCLEDEDEFALDKDLKQSQSEGDNVSEKENESSGNGECSKESAEAESSKSLFLSEDEDSMVTDSDSTSISFEHMQYLMSRLVDSYSEGFLSDEDFGKDFELDDKMSEENRESDASSSDQDDSALAGESLEESKQENLGSKFLSESDFHENAGKPENSSSESKNLKSEHESDESKLETLWEHQDLLEQLQMELKKVKATGLPTIFEESELPKMDDLKPWKIDQKFHREECIGELMLFYKSYRERMRKFDILTYQKLYAIGLLQKDQLKDPLQLLSSQKSSGPALKSSLLKNIWPSKHKSSEIDPMVKFVKELQCELESVYVGQMCLSWEFLHWQYEKSLDMWDSDPRSIHRYNEVAGEFQQFQVLLQRFIEDEPFQGPRIPYYIKCRYVFRNLLQVPVIREDKKKLKKIGKGDFVITSDVLVEILEECIRIFWRFIKADKESSTTPEKGHNPEVENAGDLELLMEVKRNLQKKERKLKETLRSESCVLRRFKRCRNEDDDDSDHVLYFFSQVDMRLVSRVLSMSKLTKEQLVWCHNKLSRISFVNRKIHVEPSFLLFQC